jgi:hypothetical protein
VRAVVAIALTMLRLKSEKSFTFDSVLINTPSH